jgi:hypothetical protein
VVVSGAGVWLLRIRGLSGGSQQSVCGKKSLEDQEDNCS